MHPEFIVLERFGANGNDCWVVFSGDWSDSHFETSASCLKDLKFASRLSRKILYWEEARKGGIQTEVGFIAA